MGEIIVGILATLIFGGLTFGLLLSLWDKPEKQRGMEHFFGMWVVAGFFGYLFITGWDVIL